MSALAETQIVKKRKPAPLPKFTGLSIPIHCILSKPNTKAVAQFHNDCRKFDADLDALHDRHAAMMEQGPDLAIRKIRALGNELIDERDKLIDELIRLRWSRFGILPNLVPDFAAAAKAAKAAHEQGYALAAKRFAKEGITAASMPAGQYATRSAEAQFRHRLGMEPEVLKTIVPMRNAEQALRGIEVGSTVPPRWKHIVVRWPSPSGEFGQHIANVAGLDRSYTVADETAGFACVVNELGFNNSPLLPGHRQTITELVAVCETVGGTARPVRGTCQQARNPSGIVELVEQLPPTREIAELLKILKSSRGF